MPTLWEAEISSYLSDLSEVQSRTLDTLARKRTMLAEADLEGLATVTAEEETLLASLQQCLVRRDDLLRRAREEGMPSESLTALVGGLTSAGKRELSGPLRDATLRARLLQHQGLVNWVLVQKALIHLSQLLEIIATGGRMQPTYGKEDKARTHGALVDQAV